MKHRNYKASWSDIEKAQLNMTYIAIENWLITCINAH